MKHWSRLPRGGSGVWDRPGHISVRLKQCPESWCLSHSWKSPEQCPINASIMGGAQCHLFGVAGVWCLNQSQDWSQLQFHKGAGSESYFPLLFSCHNYGLWGWLFFFSSHRCCLPLPCRTVGKLELGSLSFLFLSSFLSYPYSCSVM